MAEPTKTDELNVRPVPFTDVTINDAFWTPRQEVHQSRTLPVCLEKCESTGRIANFAKAAGLMAGDFQGIFYNDSDVYKVLEGVAYSLMNHANPGLEERTDSIVVNLKRAAKLTLTAPAAPPGAEGLQLLGGQ